MIVWTRFFQLTSKQRFTVLNSDLSGPLGTFGCFIK